MREEGIHWKPIAKEPPKRRLGSSPPFLSPKAIPSNRTSNPVVLSSQEKKRPLLPMISMGFFIVFSYGLLLSGPSHPTVRSLSLVFTSIMLEAMPFMLIGSLVGGVIEAFVGHERMASLLPKSRVKTILMAGLMGFVFPVCECAVVPAVRRLIGKGVPASAAIAYLLSAPIVNPIVMVSTAMAYNFDVGVAVQRTVLGYAIAVSVAFFMDWWMQGTGEVLKGGAPAISNTPISCSHGHTGCGCGPSPAQGTQENFPSKCHKVLRSAADDFLAVAHFLVIGAFIAALAQTCLERKLLLDYVEIPLLPSFCMVALAALLNLCSGSDAFIAASFRGLMPYSSQMAFMVTGPIFDLKLFLMYQTIFRRRALITLISSIAIVIGLICLGLEWMPGEAP